MEKEELEKEKIREAMSIMGKRSHEKSPRGREFYVYMGRQNKGIKKRKKRVDK